MSGFISAFREELRAGARRVSLSLMGALFLLIGLGFLTLALWLFILVQSTMLTAALIIGALYCGAGFLLLVVPGRPAPPEGARHADPNAPAPIERSPFVQLAEGFAIGLQAGRSARTPRK